jgi:hypothetical protein
MRITDKKMNKQMHRFIWKTTKPIIGYTECIPLLLHDYNLRKNPAVAFRYVLCRIVIFCIFKWRKSWYP